ncbi:MAG: hypothetical protein ACYSX0_02435, partial [Planctomycetota bacterium]
MEWRSLETHFLAATRQEPAPFGENAIEWDHSRYSRALGLVEGPGLHDLKHGGCALVAASAARWNPIVDKYKAWSKQVGWCMIRCSARPTVAVPDPVAYALGTAVSGVDSLIFARSGRGGRPRPSSKRARGEGCSIPLAPGERWLIAADRVRRRIRTESAVRGLVLVIDEAQKLSAASIGMLSYLLDAQRAWRARMLSRDAKVYVVFVTSPKHEQTVRTMLGQFHQMRAIAVSRDKHRRPSGTGSRFRSKRDPSVGLDVEEEHLCAALSAAPLALAERDLVRIFGGSVRAKIRELTERGLLVRRVEDGITCYLPNPAQVANLPEPPDRVLRALLECYRRQIDRDSGCCTGHEHVGLALAILYFRLGQPLRALGHLGRTSPGDLPTVPHDLVEELERHLEVQHRNGVLHCCHQATWIAIRAHLRDYKGAKALANRLGETPIRSRSDLVRTIVHLICMGRTHTDQVLEKGFWASLNSERVEGPLIDALCVLSDLFLNMRLMSAADAAQRYEVVLNLTPALTRMDRRRSVATSRACPPLAPLVALMMIRAESFLMPHFRQVPGTRGGRRNSAHMVPVHSEQLIPAYVSASVLFSLYYAGTTVPAVVEPWRQLSAALDSIRATGVCSDSRVLLGAVQARMSAHGLRLLMRDLADETVLLHPPAAPRALRFRLGRDLQRLTGQRAWSMSIARLLHSSPRSLREYVSDRKPEAIVLSTILQETGDFRGA